MTGLRIVPALSSHAYELAADIRPMDREEWVAGSGMRVAKALRETVERHPRSSWSVIGDDTPCIAMWGAVQVFERPHIGNAWMLATNAAARRLHSMHRLFADGIGDLHRLYPTLHAWAYEHNTLHHRWMLRMGFEGTGIERRMGMGANFLLFIRRA